MQIIKWLGHAGCIHFYEIDGKYYQSTEKVYHGKNVTLLESEKTTDPFFGDMFSLKRPYNELKISQYDNFKLYNHLTLS